MKKAYLSKTLWFNILTIVTVVATYFGYDSDPEVAERARETVIVIAPFVNILLRFITTQKISL